MTETWFWAHYPSYGKPGFILLISNKELFWYRQRFAHSFKTIKEPKKCVKPPFTALCRKQNCRTLASFLELCKHAFV